MEAHKNNLLNPLILQLHGKNKIIVTLKIIVHFLNIFDCMHLTRVQVLLSKFSHGVLAILSLWNIIEMKQCVANILFPDEWMSVYIHQYIEYWEYCYSYYSSYSYYYYYFRFLPHPRVRFVWLWDLDLFTVLFDHPLAEGQEKPEFAKQIQGFFWPSAKGWSF